MLTCEFIARNWILNDLPPHPHYRVILGSPQDLCANNFVQVSHIVYRIARDLLLRVTQCKSDDHEH